MKIVTYEDGQTLAWAAKRACASSVGGDRYSKSNWILRYATNISLACLHSGCDQMISNGHFYPDNSLFLEENWIRRISLTWEPDADYHDNNAGKHKWSSSSVACSRWSQRLTPLDECLFFSLALFTCIQSLSLECVLFKESWDWEWLDAQSSLFEA